MAPAFVSRGISEGVLLSQDRMAAFEVLRLIAQMVYTPSDYLSERGSPAIISFRAHRARASVAISRVIACVCHSRDSAYDFSS